MFNLLIYRMCKERMYLLYWLPIDLYIRISNNVTNWQDL
jgi:hypothetical protein